MHGPEARDLTVCRVPGESRSWTERAEPCSSHGTPASATHIETAITTNGWIRL
jgi:hypothetical protein